MKDKTVSIPIASLLMIITFLLGGFFGDWKASYELKHIVLNNAIVSNEAKSQVAVVANSIKNIEKSIDKIEITIKDINNKQ